MSHATGSADLVEEFFRMIVNPEKRGDLDVPREPFRTWQC
jgi:hypothetical protein